MKELIEILVGYSKPGTLYEGVAPLGETGLSRHVRAILYLEAAYRSLVRRQCWRIGMKHFFPMFLTNTGTMRESWQAEVMRIMDNPRFGSRENLTVQLFHEKFQAEPSIDPTQKDEERRLFDALMDRYRSDGYVNQISYADDQSLPRIEELVRLNMRIDLLINPKETDHAKLSKLISEMTTTINRATAEARGADGDKLRRQVVELSQQIFKREWERVKKGA